MVFNGTVYVRGAQQRVKVSMQTRSLPPLQVRNFQSFLSHSTHKLITKILQNIKNYILFFAGLTKIAIILICSHHMAIIVLAIVIF